MHGSNVDLNAETHDITLMRMDDVEVNLHHLVDQAKAENKVISIPLKLDMCILLGEHHMTSISDIAIGVHTIRQHILL